jgi:hypothetical protein
MVSFLLGEPRANLSARGVERISYFSVPGAFNTCGAEMALSAEYLQKMPFLRRRYFGHP